MDKHDKHHKPGKTRAKPIAVVAPVKTEAPAAAVVEKGKADWPGKPQAGKKSR